MCRQEGFVVFLMCLSLVFCRGKEYSRDVPFSICRHAHESARVMMRKEDIKMKTRTKRLAHKLLGLILVTLLTAALAGTAAVFAEDGGEAEDMAPNSKAAILYEATTGTVLYEKNADMQLPPASMTKVMTAILVLEQNPDLEGELTVSKDAVRHYYCSSMEPQRHLEEGEVISYEECMKYLLIPSGNEAATAFAFDMCDEYSDFIAMMNEKAEELGCENTHFADCIGLASNNHYTTPRDMVKICEYAMQFDKFRECVGQGEGMVPASNVRDEGFAYETTNYVKFPDDRYESPYSQYMTGVKTGYTPAAGWCFAGCMEKDDLVFYSVVMGGELLDYSDGERVVQGDFLDTINMYSLTDGLTPDNIEEKYPPEEASKLWIVCAAVVLAVAIGLWFSVTRKKRKYIQEESER